MNGHVGCWACSHTTFEYLPEAEFPGDEHPLHVLLAMLLLLIGVLYVFATYAVDVAYGPQGFAAFASQTGNASWEGLARSLYELVWFFVFLAIVNSPSPMPTPA